MMAMPPLPEPYAQMPHCEADPSNPYCANGVIFRSVNVYTADQLRSYGESCARMAREEAAKVDNAAEIRKCAQLVIEEAFKLPAPNEHTPRLVMLADAIQRMAIPAAAIRKG